MSVRDQYARWAKGVPAMRRRLQSNLLNYDQAASSVLTFELQEMAGLRHAEAAWLAGVTCNLARTHRDLLAADAGYEQNGWIYTWATHAPNLREDKRIHINERRFERWLNAATDDARLSEWYDYTLEALKVVRGNPFDIRTLFDTAAHRCCDDLPDFGIRSFAGRCALEFYSHQPQALTKRAPMQTPTESLINPPPP